MIKNHLKIIVLKLLQNEKKTGYDLIKQIHTTTGHWKPSYGSIYPLLKELHTQELVYVKTEGRKKIYAITPLGKKALQKYLASKDEIAETMSKMCTMIESLSSEKDKKIVQLMTHSIKNDTSIAGELTDPMDRLQRILFDIILSKDVEKKQKKVALILEDTIKKIKKV